MEKCSHFVESLVARLAGGSANFTVTDTFTAHCQKHGQYTAKRYQSGRVSPCPTCLKEKKDEEFQEYAEEIKRHNSMQAAKVVREKLAQSVDIPPRFIGKTVANWQPENDAEKAIKKAIVNYGFAIQSGKAGALILHGNKGTGKTHLACALLSMRKAQMGGSVQYATVADLFRKVRESKRFSSTPESELIEEYAKFDLLALDEIGNQRGDDDEKRILFDVLNKRYEKALPTVLVSNLTQEKLEEFLGEVLWDRLQENSFIVSFSGKSRRVARNIADGFSD